jgi:hypothetical protein
VYITGEADAQAGEAKVAIDEAETAEEGIMTSSAEQLLTTSVENNGARYTLLAEKRDKIEKDMHYLAEELKKHILHLHHSLYAYSGYGHNSHDHLAQVKAKIADLQKQFEYAVADARAVFCDAVEEFQRQSDDARIADNDQIRANFEDGLERLQGVIADNFAAVYDANRVREADFETETQAILDEFVWSVE